MKAKRLVIWVSLVFTLDQLSKWLVSQWIPLGSKVPIIPNIFDLVYVTNKGAAFGFLAGLADPYRFIILTLVSVIAVVLIFYYYWTLPAKSTRMQIPLALILGGAFGNIFDRLFHGSVIDFLSFHWYDKWVHWGLGSFRWEFKLEWPAFNVADMAISCSVIWLICVLMREQKTLKE